MSGGGQSGGGGFGQQSNYGGMGQGYGQSSQGYGNKMGGQSFGGGNPWMKRGYGNQGYGNMSNAAQPGGYGRPGMSPGTFTPQSASPIAPPQNTGSMSMGGMVTNQMYQPQIGDPRMGGAYFQTAPTPTLGAPDPSQAPAPRPGSIPMDYIPPGGTSPLSGPDGGASQPGQPGKIGMQGNPAFTGNSPNGLNYSGSNAPGAGWQEMLRQYAMRDNQQNVNQYAQDRNLNPMWGNQLQPWEYNGRNG